MPRLIAVAMGSHSVKVSTWRGQRGSWDLEERHSQRVPQGGELPQVEQRFAALDALLEDVPSLHKAPNDVVAFAMPGGQAAFHRITLPFTDRAQVEDTLPFALEAEVPFDLDTMVLGWRPLRRDTETEAMVVLVRQESVRSWVSELAERRLDPANVFVDSALYGWFVDKPPPSDEEGPNDLVAVIDIGHAHTVVSVVRDGVVAYCRTINVGGFAFTAAIQGALECSWEEAEELKHRVPAGSERHSGYSALAAPARKAVDGAIGLLLAEVRSTLIDAEDALQLEVGEVRLTGGSSRLDELWSYFAQDLGVQVKGLRDPNGERFTPAYALTQALAMHAVQGDDDVVDLRIGDLAYRGGADVLRLTLTYGTAAMVVFALAAVVMFAVRYTSLNSEQSEVMEQMTLAVVEAFPEVSPTMITDGLSAVGIAAGYASDWEQQAEVLGDGSNSIPPTTDTIAALTEAFPPHPDTNVEVSELNITPQAITFNAETASYAMSASVEEKLQATPRFATATKGTETKLSNGRIKFPITISLEEEEDSETGEEEEG